MLHRFLLLPFCLCGCPAPADSGAPDSEAEPPLEALFSFAVLADPHLFGDADNEARWLAAAEWVNAHAADEGIELVLIVGDIAWSAGLAGAPALLGTLEPPWVPITGDNEVNSGDEQAFYEAFSPQWEALGAQLDGFARAPAPVHHPEAGQDAWFTNLVFDHGGLRFVGLDFCARGAEGLFAEMADLHDFEGGTLPWLLASLGSTGTAEDSVVLFSHHPMHLSPGSFDQAEIEALDAALAPWEGPLFANFAGHYHENGDTGPESGLWQVFVTDATKDDEVTVRLVRVSGNGQRFAYEQELVVVQ